MREYKMSNNDAWDAEDNNFSADVLVTVDDANKYKSTNVLLTKKNVNEVDASISLIISSEGSYQATLTMTDSLPKQAEIADVSRYARSLEDYSNFMELLEAEANSQLQTVDGIFETNKINR